MSDETVFGPTVYCPGGTPHGPLIPEEIQSLHRPSESERPMKVCELSVRSMHEAQSLVTLLASNGYLVTIKEANLQLFWVKVWE